MTSPTEPAAPGAPLDRRIAQLEDEAVVLRSEARRAGRIKLGVYLVVIVVTAAGTWGVHHDVMKRAVEVARVENAAELEETKALLLKATGQIVAISKEGDRCRELLMQLCAVNADCRGVDRALPPITGPIFFEPATVRMPRGQR